jgi:hypothetical protein
MKKIRNENSNLIQKLYHSILHIFLHSWLTHVLPRALNKFHKRELVTEKRKALSR